MMHVGVSVGVHKWQTKQRVGEERPGGVGERWKTRNQGLRCHQSPSSIHLAPLGWFCSPGPLRSGRPSAQWLSHSPSLVTTHGEEGGAHIHQDPPAKPHPLQLSMSSPLPRAPGPITWGPVEAGSQGRGPEVGAA